MHLRVQMFERDLPFFHEFQCKIDNLPFKTESTSRAGAVLL